MRIFREFFDVVHDWLFDASFHYRRRFILNRLKKLR